MLVPVSPFTSIGSSSGGNNQTPFDDSALVAKLNTLIMEVKAWPTKLRVENVVTETRDKTKAINDIQARADV